MRRVPTQYRVRRGVALLEVIVGSVMLGIGLAVVVSLTSRAMARQVEGEMRTQAAWLADGLLAMVIVESPKEFSKVQELEGRFEAPFDAFTYAVEIQDVQLGLLYEVTATVAWEGRQATQTVNVQTQVSQQQFYADEDLDLVNAREPAEALDRESRWYDDDEAF